MHIKWNENKNNIAFAQKWSNGKSKMAWEYMKKRREREGEKKGILCKKKRDWDRFLTTKCKPFS